MATPVNFTSLVPSCTPTLFNWTGGIPPFRLNLTIVDPTANSGLVFGISFDGLQQRGFTLSLPFPAGTGASFNVLSNATSPSTAVPSSVITSHFTIGGEQGSGFGCTFLDIENDRFASSGTGGDISLSGTDNSTESCRSNVFDWTGGTPPYRARFALKTAPTGNLNVTQNATIDISGITRNGISINLPYDTGATLGLSVSEGNAKISTDPSKARSVFLVAGGTSNCFLQPPNLDSSSSNDNNNGRPKNLPRIVGPSAGGTILLLIIIIIIVRARRPPARVVTVAPTWRVWEREVIVG